MKENKRNDWFVQFLYTYRYKKIIDLQIWFLFMYAIQLHVSVWLKYTASNDSLFLFCLYFQNNVFCLGVCMYVYYNYYAFKENQGLLI